jgi:hypothetical protein
MVLSASAEEVVFSLRSNNGWLCIVHQLDGESAWHVRAFLDLLMVSFVMALLIGLVQGNLLRPRKSS